MMRWILMMAGCHLFAAGCATTAVVKDPAIHPCPRGAVAVEVSEGSGPMLTDVSCKIRSRKADISCPPTDSIARTCLDPAVLLDPDGLAIEFCKEGYFCGAFRMEDERDFRSELGRRVSTEVCQIVYDRFSEITGKRMPVLAGDDLSDLYGIVDEDLVDELRELAVKCLTAAPTAEDAFLVSTVQDAALLMESLRQELRGPWSRQVMDNELYSDEYYEDVRFPSNAELGQLPAWRQALRDSIREKRRQLGGRPRRRQPNGPVNVETTSAETEAMATYDPFTPQN